MNAFYAPTRDLDRDPHTDPDTRFQCRHIFPDGHRCGSPCLRSEELCYYHHTTRRPIADAPARKARRGTFLLPNPADLIHRSGIQLAIAEVLQRIASNDLDPRRAGLLLYGLQTASLNLPRTPAQPEPVILVDEITHHPTLGILAPIARIADLLPISPATQLLEQLCRDEIVEEDVLRNIHQDASLQPLEPGTLPAILAVASPQPNSPSNLQSNPNRNPLRTLPRIRREGGAFAFPRKNRGIVLPRSPQLRYSSPVPRPSPSKEFLA